MEVCIHHPPPHCLYLRPSAVKSNGSPPDPQKNPGVAERSQRTYSDVVSCLTAQERKVLIIVMLLLVIGELVKVYRVTHPPVTTAHPAST